MLLLFAILMGIFPFSIGIRLPKIAIIGGGIGGASCAHFIKKAFPPNISVTLFEQNEIGGRLSTVDINEQSYEAGGSVIHPKNKYLLEFAKFLDLEHRKSYGGHFGLYNGQQFVFQESTWSLVTFVQLLWRYGFDIFRLQNTISSLLNDFSRIYSAQEKGFSYSTVSGLLKQMHPVLWNLTQETLLSYMKREGFSDLFIEEIVQAVTLVNYGQTVNMSAFAGAVAIAGADMELWSIEGGNKLVPYKLLEKLDIKIIHGQVTDVSLEELGTFVLSWKTRFHVDVTDTSTFDIVILAAPLIKGMSEILFRNFPTDFNEYKKAFHRTVATFVCGKLNNSAFQGQHVPDEILTNNGTLVFNSIGIVFPVSGIDPGRKTVYKVFSQKTLSDEQIHSLFDDIQEVKIKDWLAYPHYTTPEESPPFILYSGLYYINAIEWAASAMEMSAIGGKNVALLAYNLWNDKTNLIDNQVRILRDEL